MGKMSLRAPFAGLHAGRLEGTFAWVQGDASWRTRMRTRMSLRAPFAGRLAGTFAWAHGDAFLRTRTRMTLRVPSAGPSGWDAGRSAGRFAWVQGDTSWRRRTPMRLTRRKRLGLRMRVRWRPMKVSTPKSQGFTGVAEERSSDMGSKKQQGEQKKRTMLARTSTIILRRRSPSKRGRRQHGRRGMCSGSVATEIDSLRTALLLLNADNNTI